MSGTAKPSRRKPKVDPGAGMAAWGWYGILFVPASDAPGGSGDR